MDTALVKSAPAGDFAEVSVLKSGWQAQLHSLVTQKKPIKYDYYPLPGIPEEVCASLREHGYRHLVLEHDRWQHFLVPHAN